MRGSRWVDRHVMRPSRKHDQGHDEADAASDRNLDHAVERRVAGTMDYGGSKKHQRRREWCGTEMGLIGSSGNHESCQGAQQITRSAHAKVRVRHGVTRQW